MGLATYQQQPSTHDTHPPFFLTWSTIWKIATQALPDKDRTKADAILEHLQHKGIITHMQNDGRFPHYEEPEPSEVEPTPYADCLIPTLSEHICKTIALEDMAKIQSAIDGIIQKKAHLARTQWCWSQAIHMKKITQIPSLDYIPPVFPRVFTPNNAREESNQLRNKMEQNPETRDPFIQQTIHDMRRATEPALGDKVIGRIASSRRQRLWLPIPVIPIMPMGCKPHDVSIDTPHPANWVLSLFELRNIQGPSVKRRKIVDEKRRLGWDCVLRNHMACGIGCCFRRPRAWQCPVGIELEHEQQLHTRDITGDVA